MVVDASVLVAIELNEEGFELLLLRIGEAEYVYVSTASYLEAAMVLTRYKVQQAEDVLDRLLFEAGIILVPVSAQQVRVAVDAFRRFGKGRHLAKLNFGDCFSYALAKSLDEPLLFIGNDFSQTDITAA